MIPATSQPFLHAVRRSRATRVSLAAAVLLLSACASTPPAPTDDIQAAESAIGRAEEARVADYASVELSQARDKLVASRAAAEKEDMGRARQLAREAKLDAELATAKAEAARAKGVNAEMQKNIETLRQETQRKVSP